VASDPGADLPADPAAIDGRDVRDRIRASRTIDGVGRDGRGVDDPFDRRIARVAGRQHGLVTTTQLLAVGVTRRAIDRRVANGRLFRVHRGVYSVGVPVSDRADVAMAAVLACGPSATLSHTTAAIFLDLLPHDGAEPHVTVTGRDVRRPGIHVHRVSTAPARTTRNGLPVTTAERTLLDLAATERDDVLARAVNEAQVLRRTTRVLLRREVEQAGRRNGAARLRRLLEEDAEGFTRSEAERRLRRLIVEAGLPRPEYNRRVHGHEADAVWPVHRLIVEVDGFSAHGHRDAFERDRRRDAERQARGWRTLRITWRQLTREPLRVVAVLARTLAT
jgi:very-short-patch-repair endonuclease